MNLDNKTALITGSNRGIGRAIMERFVSEGCNIVAHARKPSIDFQEDIKSLMEKYHVKITPIYFDLTDSQSLSETLYSLIKDTNIDILVNNAGQYHAGLFLMTPIDDIKNIFNINLFSMLEITQIIAKSMLRNKSGIIINLASQGAGKPSIGDIAYGTSKAGIVTITKILAAELGQFGLRVNAIAPGLTNTDMGNAMSDRARNNFLKHCPYHRIARLDEIASIVAFLASDNASFINGETIRVDGGNI